MDGANALMRTLVESGITTLFTNPGTTELHLVEAAEATAGLRSVLALFEGVASGAADGYGRIARRPAAVPGPLLEHGAGLPDFPRLGFYPEQAVAQLKGASHVLLAGVHEPVVMGFAYLGQPSSPVPADAAMVTLAAPDEDTARALADLAAIVAPGTAAKVAAVARPAMPSGPLTLQSWPQVLGSAPAGERPVRRSPAAHGPGKSIVQLASLREHLASSS